MNETDKDEILICPLCNKNPAVVIVNVTVDSAIAVTYTTILCASCYVTLTKTRPDVKLT